MSHTNGRNGKVHRRKRGRKKKVRRGEQSSLKDVLTDILQKSKRPISGQKLAEKVLKTGYKTTSKNFITVIWVALRNVDGVENVPGKGYRLKSSKG